MQYSWTLFTQFIPVHLCEISPAPTHVHKQFKFINFSDLSVLNKVNPEIQLNWSDLMDSFIDLFSFKPSEAIWELVHIFTEQGFVLIRGTSV